MRHRYIPGTLTGTDFQRIRHGLLMTQREMAQALGYAQKIRISEYERSTNAVTIPLHIQRAVIALYESGGVAGRRRTVVRPWTRASADA